MGGNLMFNNGQKPDKLTQGDLAYTLRFLKQNSICPVYDDLLTGSCRNRHYFNDDHLFGDVDIFVFEDFYVELEGNLDKVDKNIVSKKIGKRRSSVVFKIDNKFHQVDFIRVTPTNECQVDKFDVWAHDSSYTDSVVGLKGVALKMLMRAITGTELIRLPNGTVTNLYAFSVDHGLRRKYFVNSEGKFTEYTNKTYNRNIASIFETFNIFIDWKFMWSFVNVSHTLKQNYPFKYEHVKMCLVKLLNDCQEFDSDKTVSDNLKQRIIEVYETPEKYLI